jgi:heme exporter protein A
MRLVGCDLACVRGGREVFSGLNFAIAAGEALAISGPNGAGKSSLLRVIAGLVPQAAGTLTLEGGDPELTIGEQAHYLGHLDALKPSLSVEENLGFWAEFLGGSDSEPAGADRGRAPAGSRIGAALAAVGLERIAALPAAYLSAGQRRRLSIARLIAVPRPIWLLDEPTSALDVAAQATLARLMRDHRAGGGMILAAIHGSIGLENFSELRLGQVLPDSGVAPILPPHAAVAAGPVPANGPGDARDGRP